ncbi:type VI secretion system Vgr family protein [Hahella ganghwensis]|uniref:type VI secretion system Vgr family protein n=1 Tax=Hahella ganghwensis TaxID=286420 RepID=UPI00037F6CEC|nr:type VI secretion system tip protein VgrG [Hahella ganghwensis]
MSIKQENQVITVSSPLGADVLLMNRFHATEALSSPFSITLDVHSSEESIDPAKIVGKSVTIKVSSDPDNPRYFNGIVSSFMAGGSQDRRVRDYFLKLVPWFSLLQFRQNSRIFQDKSVKDIITSIFSEMGFSDFEWKLQKSYQPRVYCVQYRETDFKFISRLLQEEGIFYYFKHEDGKHTMVISDYAKGYDSVPASSLDVVDGSHTDFTINGWKHGYHFVSGKVELTDYNFETPATSLTAFQKSLVKLPNIDKFEVYDYPGEYGQKTEGDNYATTRMEALESAYSSVDAGSNYPPMTAGFVFTVGDHHDKSEKKAKYVLTRVEHHGEEGGYRAGSSGGGTYSNKFTCAPAATVIRPSVTIDRPIISGTQTALVVGPSSEEIFTDEYGRIKVQFYWDREGKKDDKSSCWIRVAQIWSGKKWGAQYIPRIGQEVVISFLEGDPDRPLVIGSVYNAEVMPPYDLPANKAHSGVKSRSTKEGGKENYNEIMFIDEKGSELVRVHAEKDRNITVENDDTESVGNDQSIAVGKNQTEDVGENRTTNIGKDDSETVGNNQSITVGKDQTINIDKNKVENIGGKSSLAVEKEAEISIGKDLTESVGGKYTESVTKEYALDAKKIQLTAADEISIKVGKASITMKKNGDISINGAKINAKGSGVITIKGSQIKEN